MKRRTLLERPLQPSSPRRRISGSSVGRFQLRQDSRGIGQSECNLVRKGWNLPALPYPGAGSRSPRRGQEGGTFIITDLTEKKAMTEALRGRRSKVPRPAFQYPEHHHPAGPAGTDHFLQYLCPDIFRLCRRGPDREERGRDHCITECQVRPRPLHDGRRPRIQ